MMDPKIKAEWIAELEGKYADKHARERLVEYKYDDYGDANGIVGYCCLGVLMEIQGCADIPNAVDSLDTWYVPAEYRAGLTAENCQDLANLNDKSDSFVPVIEAIKAL